MYLKGWFHRAAAVAVVGIFFVAFPSGVPGARRSGRAEGAENSPDIPAAVSADARQPEAFSFDMIVERARELSGKPYVAPKAFPEVARKMNYDDWRNIRFKPERSLWRDEGLPFELQFFHSGFYYDRNIALNVLEAGKVSPVLFSTDLFQYPDDGLKGAVSASSMGFAGFRLHYPIKRPDYKDEVAVFLGASYLRAVARDTHYGLSARGLALDTALPSGEEFPWFREFWLPKPASADATLSVYALLDSPSVSGAYHFLIRPGEETLVDVEGRIFFRKPVEKVGLAPLTSMYFYGETENGRPGDYRPEVHDSDGLLVHNDEGGWRWHALSNGERLGVSRFPLKALRGFGLFQRDQDFDHYQDLEAHYHQRASLWIEPKNDWGPGNLELIEIPSDTEFNDNIVAFWVPDGKIKERELFAFSYRMGWRADDAGLHGLGRVAGTRRASGDRKEWARFLVDFEGGELDGLSPDAGLNSVVQTEGARVVQKHLEKNTQTGGWRLSFQIEPEDGGAFSVFPAVGRVIRLSAFLNRGENIPQPLTETWSYSFIR